MLGGKGAFTSEDAMNEAREYFNKKNTGYFLAVNSSNRLVGFRRLQ